jgi:hypothetical protein
MDRQHLEHTADSLLLTVAAARREFSGQRCVEERIQEKSVTFTCLVFEL